MSLCFWHSCFRARTHLWPPLLRLRMPLNAILKPWILILLLSLQRRFASGNSLDTLVLRLFCFGVPVLRPLPLAECHGDACSYCFGWLWPCSGFREWHLGDPLQLGKCLLAYGLYLAAHLLMVLVHHQLLSPWDLHLEWLLTPLLFLSPGVLLGCYPEILLTQALSHTPTSLRLLSVRSTQIIVPAIAPASWALRLQMLFVVTVPTVVWHWSGWPLPRQSRLGPASCICWMAQLRDSVESGSSWVVVASSSTRSWPVGALLLLLEGRIEILASTVSVLSRVENVSFFDAVAVGCSKYSLEMIRTSDEGWLGSSLVVCPGRQDFLTLFMSSETQDFLTFVFEGRHLWPHVFESLNKLGRRLSARPTHEWILLLELPRFKLIECDHSGLQIPGNTIVLASIIVVLQVPGVSGSAPWFITVIIARVEAQNVMLSWIDIDNLAPCLVFSLHVVLVGGRQLLVLVFERSQSWVLSCLHLAT